MGAVQRTKVETLPNHLKDAHYKAASKLGHGVDYKYAHLYPNHYVEQQYLPDELLGSRFYYPTANGHEQEVRDWFEFIRPGYTREEEKS